MTKLRWIFLAAGIVLILLLFFWVLEGRGNGNINSSTPISGTSTTNYTGWEAYAGGKDGNRYSSNSKINKENIAQLQEVWSYSTGDKDESGRSQIQCNPIVKHGVLYGTSPQLKLFAVDAATGEQIWLFDPYNLPGVEKSDQTWFNVNRGVVYWEDENGNNSRILFSAGPFLYAIDAKDGRVIRSFGQDGSIDLRKNLDRENTENAFVAGTTPGVIYKDLLIMGMRVTEGADAAPGHIRAFDVRTGERRWIFHTIPHPEEPGYETWKDPDAWKYIGGANAWAGMSLDEEGGVVFVPTGTAGPDFYGGVRKGKNLYANSLIALDAATGKYNWHYQIIHHDLWDRDLPANPNLITLNKDGNKIDAVAQITKHGYIFLFDRKTGDPIFPIEEKAFSGSDLPGEEAWPTQPIPTLPEPFARQHFTAEDVSTINPEEHPFLLEAFNNIENKNMFDPPGKGGTLIFPGFDGGGEWGGAAVDLQTNILYINSSEVPWVLTMIDIPQDQENASTLRGKGRSVYNKYCISCHGQELEGNGSSYPSLENLGHRYMEEQVRHILDNGKNRMPSFNQIPEEDKKALLTFLLDLQEEQGVTSTEISKEPINSQNQEEDVKRSILDEIPYTTTGYNKFEDEQGYPAIKPPWGTLNAVDLNSGNLLWKVPLGEFEELTSGGIPVTGTPNYGGPLVTAGGLVIIASTMDSKIRGFDKDTGEMLWEANLPVPGYATPATYMVDGRQYIVIACGGGKLGSPSGDQYVAFALPDFVKQ